jgi:hypothetical protein
MSSEEYLTITEAKVYLGVSEYKIGKLVYGDPQKGTTPAFPSIPNPYREGSRLIKRSDLDAWLASAPRRPKKFQKEDPEGEVVTENDPAA